MRRGDVRIAIFTQDERLFLPIPIGHVLDELSERVSYVALCSPMSTHGGWWRGIRRHVPVFGVRGTLKMAWKNVAAKIGPLLRSKPIDREYWSIAHAAKQHNIPIVRLENPNDEDARKIVAGFNADLLVSVSCPQVLSPKVLALFRCGAINVHSGALPKYRGLMPTFWVLYHQEQETAVTVHFLDSKIDNGGILVQHQIPIVPGESWESLVRKTKMAAGEALFEAIENIRNDTLDVIPNNDSDASYFSFPERKHAVEFRRRGGRMF